MSDQYFATKDAADVAAILLRRSESFFNNMKRNDYLDRVRKCWMFYHGIFNDAGYNNHEVTFAGEQGEYAKLPANHFRNLAEHITRMLTSNRPTMEARAVNTDAKSLSQAYLANGILDYYMREKHLEPALTKALEMAVVMGVGYIKMDWNATGGEIYDHDEETNSYQYEGEIEFSNLSLTDVVFDGTKENWNHDWMVVRTWQNKYNLMAKYPELADDIQGIKTKSDSYQMSMRWWSNDETDDIAVYEFYHKRTEAMPNGRYLLFLDNDIVLLDTQMPYRQIPIFRVVPSEILGTCYGYSPMFDIYPLQEAINVLYSSLFTNQAAFGVHNIYVPPNSNITSSQLDGGLNIIEGNAKPEAVNLLSSAPELFKALELYIETAETLSGVNSVARGNPEASLRSGAALALVQSMALQFVSGLQKNYVKMIEDVGTALINTLKDFATAPKVVALVGKNNKTYLKEFTGDDVGNISRVIVDVGNPLARCLKKDTPILMYDGSVKMVQNVQINDRVMGPDSKPRTVTNTNSGQEMMYDIYTYNTRTGGDFVYGCNESHILTLKYCSDDSRYDVKKGQIIDISVRDYLKLPKRHQHILMGFRRPVTFKPRTLPIPPRILGMWIGDGSSRDGRLTTMDYQLANEWIQYGNSLGLQTKVYTPKTGSRAKDYRITSGKSHGSSNRNSFINELRNLNLIQNKHIPHSYLTTSKQDRLELLAGLLDTDGTLVSGTTFIITQKNQATSDGIVFLARSLGFKVTTRKKRSYSGPDRKNPSAKRKYCGLINSITIGGDVWEIPTLLPRKMVVQHGKHRNWLNYGIDARQTGFGDYYGFTLKEDPHFMLGDFTVTHNTVAGRVQMAEQLLQMKLLKHPQQYFQIIETGKLEVAYEGEEAELLLIKSENEKMMDGISVPALIIDQHLNHINEHKTLLADTDLRSDPKIRQVVLTHIQEHIDILRNGDPALLQLIGETPLAPPAPPGMPPGMQPPPGAPGPHMMPPTGPGQQSVPQKSLRHSPNGGVLQPPQDPTKGGDKLIGPGNPQNQNPVQSLPKVPHPPGQFKNDPVLPEQMLPKT